MTLPSVETARNWSGLTAVDSDDQPLGRITGIYLDHDTGQPEWALVAPRSAVAGPSCRWPAPPARATESPWPCPRQPSGTRRRSGRAGSSPMATRPGCTGTTSGRPATATGAPAGHGVEVRSPGGGR
jgi:hypothetical protein